MFGVGRFRRVLLVGHRCRFISVLSWRLSGHCVFLWIRRNDGDVLHGVA